MPVSTENKKEDFTRAEPAQNEFWDREGYDQEQLRYEFAQPMNLSLDDKYVEREERDAIDPRTLELPTAPTGMGEVSSSGMEVLTIDGKRWDTYRIADGFTVSPEDDNNVGRQRQGIMKTLSFLYDGYFFRGMDHSSQWNGVFDYIDSALPSERVIDCEDYDGDSGDDDLTGHEEDLIASVAFEKADHRILDPSDGWATMVGSKSVMAKFRASQATDQGFAGPSYFERLQSRGAVQDFTVLPPELKITNPPRDSELEDADVPTIDLIDESTAVNPSTAPLGYDEAYLFPNMDTVTSDFWALGEMSTPRYFNSDARMGKTAHDYVSRFTAYENPSGEYAECPDILKLENVSTLFGV